jgi:hypothetical protein
MSLKNGEASRDQQELASRLLRDAFMREQGRPAFVVKPAGGYKHNIEILAIEWILQNGGRDFARAIKNAVQQVTQGIRDFDEGAPTEETIRKYYDREKAKDRIKDIKFYEDVLSAAKTHGVEPDELISSQYSKNEREKLFALLRFRHGRQCFKRGSKARSAAKGIFAPEAPPKK